jgi:hypothetical protein
MTISKSIQTLFYVSALVCSVTSCSNDDDTTATDALTQEEAVELVEGALQKSTNGLNETTKSYSEELATDITLNDLCGTLYDENFQHTFNGTFIAAQYEIDWSYLMTCNNFNTPVTAAFDATSSGTYSTQRIQSNDTSQSYFDVSGLEFSSPSLFFNGDYTRLGSQQITINQNTRSINSSLIINVTNLEIDKVDYEITTGTGVVNLTGTTNQGNAFSFQGGLVFNGNGTATLTLNGAAYVINLI